MTRPRDFQRRGVYRAEDNLKGGEFTVFGPLTPKLGSDEIVAPDVRLMTGRWIQTAKQAQTLADRVVADHLGLVPAIPWSCTRRRKRCASAGLWNTPARYRGVRQIRFPAHPFDPMFINHARTNERHQMTREGFFNRELVHLHEIAHCFDDCWRDRHGPKFTRCLLHLVDKYIGAPAAAELRSQYTQLGVLVAGGPTKVTITPSDPVRVA